MLPHSESTADSQNPAAQQSEGTCDDPSSQVQVQIPAMATDMAPPSPDAKRPESQLFPEERTHLARGAASKRKKVVEIDDDEGDNSGDASYHPDGSPLKRTRPNATASTAKSNKGGKKPRKVNTVTPSTSASASESQTAKAKTKRTRAPPQKKKTVPKKTAFEGVLETASTDGTDGAMPTQIDKESEAPNNSRLLRQAGKERGVNVQSGSSGDAQTSARDLEANMSDEARQRAVVISDCATSQIYEIDRDLQRARDEVRSWSEKYQALKAENLDLQQKNARLEEMKPTKAPEIMRLTARLLDLKNLPLGYPKLRMIDDEIDTLWFSVTEKIRSVSVRVAIGIFRSPGTGRENSRFPYVLGQALQAGPFDIERCAALLQNWIWRCMVELVIESADGHWPAPISRAFVEYYRQLLPLLEKGEVSAEFVSQVKSSNCCGIERAHEALSNQASGPAEYAISISKIRSGEIKDEIARDLEALWDATEEDRQAIDELLRAIINKSRLLGRALLSSKAIFRIGSLEPFTSPHGADGIGTQPTRHIVTSPSLNKQGTTEGDLFDSRHDLRKRQVFPPTEPDENVMKMTT